MVKTFSGKYFNIFSKGQSIIELALKTPSLHRNFGKSKWGPSCQTTITNLWTIAVLSVSSFYSSPGFNMIMLQKRCFEKNRTKFFVFFMVEHEGFEWPDAPLWHSTNYYLVSAIFLEIVLYWKFGNIQLNPFLWVI